MQTDTPRVRFAPSPTGFLHIGGARTALFNWLYARHTGGVFVLRIEDTDAARNTPEAVEVILQGLRWLGLDWDEGPASSSPTGPSKGDRGPYFQSQRGENYQRRVHELIEKGQAYARDGAVLFRMPREPIVISDLVVGEVTRKLTDREEADPDFVLVRSDGQPVFHLVNVVDDLEMGITHVIRGEDHLSNTAKHIALFRAFGVPPPRYAHIPLILNADGTKMSKRDQGASLTAYDTEGYLPAAVVNFLCLLGWSPKDDRQVLPIPDVVKLFDLPQILRHNARFDMAKLQWMNWEYVRGMDAKPFCDAAKSFLQRGGFHPETFPQDYVRAALLTCKEKIKRFTEITEWAGFYFVEEVVIAEADRAAIALERSHLERLRIAWAALEPFDATNLEAKLKALAIEIGIKPKQLVHPARLACTGRSIGPSLYHLLEVLGQARVLQRLDAALASTATLNS